MPERKGHMPEILTKNRGIGVEYRQ